MELKFSFRFIGFLFFLVPFQLLAQRQNEIILPDTIGWNILNEGDTLSLRLATNTTDQPFFTVEGAKDLGIHFDTLGDFEWTPSYDLVNRIEKTKEFTVIFQATWSDSLRDRKSVTFTIRHVNRPPVVEELPIVYVKQSSLNNYQIASDYVYDPDGDPLVIKSIPSQMPEGAVLSSLGLFSWTPSRSQFYSLRTNPLIIEFIAQDQPDKLETKGKLRVQQTQQDLPSEILIVPGDTVFTIKEDETLNLKLYISDPNGDDDVKNVGFIANDMRIRADALKQNTPLQQEFTWTPGYDFVDEAQKTVETGVTFFALDKSNNRAQRKIKIIIKETENLVEKDAHQYQKYKTNLTAAMLLIEQLDANQKKLNNDYKKAKKGKKNRSILNASLGAATGLSPVTLETDKAKVVSGIGGTTVLTLGTLEATEVIGKSKEDIMDKIKIGIDLRNKLQSSGDEFARKYALKSSRRSSDFEKDIERLRSVMNDQKLVLLELDAYSKTGHARTISNKDIRKVFLDFSDE